MKIKENIKNLTIPQYSEEQENFNFYTHLLGVPLGITTLIISIIMFVMNKIAFDKFIGLIIFSITIILLYSISSIYHKAKNDSKSKKIKRVLDHCTIYLLIAGTYTPICLYIYDQNIIGLILLILEWSLAIIGVILNAIDLQNKAVQIISMILYILLGWMILYSTGFIYLTQVSFTLILIGGISYTLGSILYGLGHKKNLWFHTVFHVFVLLGTIFQAIGVFLLFA